MTRSMKVLLLLEAGPQVRLRHLHAEDPLPGLATLHVGEPGKHRSDLPTVRGEVGRPATCRRCPRRVPGRRACSPSSSAARPRTPQTACRAGRFRPRGTSNTSGPACWWSATRSGSRSRRGCSRRFGILRDADLTGLAPSLSDQDGWDTQRRTAHRKLGEELRPVRIGELDRPLRWQSSPFSARASSITATTRLVCWLKVK